MRTLVCQTSLTPINQVSIASFICAVDEIIRVKGMKLYLVPPTFDGVTIGDINWLVQKYYYRSSALPSGRNHT